MRLAKLALLCFLVPIFIITLANQVVTKPTVSESENRVLSARPDFGWDSLFGGTLLRQYEDYFADTFILRDRLVRISRRVRGWYGFETADEARLVAQRGANLAQNRGDSLTLMLIAKNQAMEIHRFNPESSRVYAETLNRFQQRVGAGVKVYSLVAPTRIEFSDRPDYRSLSSPQKHTIDYVNQHLNPDIRRVDAYSSLAENASRDIYFRTDHHWTALGAYCSYTAFMNARGEEPVPLERYQTGEAGGFLGSLYTLSMDRRLEQDPDTIRYYLPFTGHQYTVYYERPVDLPVIDRSRSDQRNKYEIFMGGDHPLGEIFTSVKNGKKIAVIKDSYGNALIPFLIPHYQEIYVIDPREFRADVFEFIKSRGIQEVLFINYILATQNTDVADVINDMMER
ncbi:MAG: hypothetical protein HPY50_09100 [Firmicutes bacterium]|nr:hypothetical protein [Bacillota bacterium]